MLEFEFYRGSKQGVRTKHCSFGVSIPSSSIDLFNDLWKYNPLTNQWTWVNGDNYENVTSVLVQRVLLIMQINRGQDGEVFHGLITWAISGYSEARLMIRQVFFMIIF